MSQSDSGCLLMVEKRQLSGCLKNSNSVALQQCRNQAGFQLNGSGIVSKFLLSF